MRIYSKSSCVLKIEKLPIKIFKNVYFDKYHNAFLEVLLVWLMIYFTLCVDVVVLSFYCYEV